LHPISPALFKETGSFSIPAEIHQDTPDAITPGMCNPTSGRLLKYGLHTNKHLRLPAGEIKIGSRPPGLKVEAGFRLFVSEIEKTSMIILLGAIPAIAACRRSGAPLRPSCPRGMP
jgi:hypothetical protein